MTESKNHLPQAEISNISESGSCVSIACTQSEHLKARPADVAVGDGGTAWIRRSKIEIRRQTTLRAFLPALIVILSRRRRISVKGTFESLGNKYQSAGRRRFAAVVGVF
jgi:hypothetical protein